MADINILLADDDKDDCLLFKEALEELHLPTNLTVMYDGDQLMHHLALATQEFAHVLFLDINMPRKNGLECLEEIKSDEKLKHLPVFILSTSCDERIVEQLYQYGAYHYICKPVDFSQFKMLILRALSIVSLKDNTQPSRENFLLDDLEERFIL